MPFIYSVLNLSTFLRCCLCLTHDDRLLPHSLITSHPCSSEGEVLRLVLRRGQPISTFLLAPYPSKEGRLGVTNNPSPVELFCSQIQVIYNMKRPLSSLRV